MKKTRIAAAVAALAVAALMGVLFRACVPTPDGGMTFPRGALSIVLSDGQSLAFNVEVATTPEQLARGLMFRRVLPRDEGMLFVFPQEGEQSFWMKNTWIPLDMLFVRKDGTVFRVVANATPFDLTPIPSGGPALAVIELNGGEAGRQGIVPGSRVIHPAFSPSGGVL
jgi:uncharacterized membrane protein (UPF0127 family)